MSEHDDTNAEIVFYAAEEVGSINPHDYRCPSCNELQDVREIDDDLWHVWPRHKPDCLRAQRGCTNPEAN